MWKAERERHAMSAKGIKTKEHNSFNLNYQNTNDGWDKLHSWLDKKHITLMPGETMDWYEVIVCNNTPQYFFYTDWGEKTFLKSNKPFTKEEINYIETALKTIYKFNE